MNSSQVTTIVISVLNFVLAAIVFLRNRRNIVNISFFLFTFAVSFWGVTYIIAQLNGQLFWGRMVFVFGLLMGGGFLLFAKTFPRVIKKITALQYLLFFGPVAFLIILLFTTDWILAGFTTHENNLEPQLGSAYYVLIIYVVLAVIYGIVSLIMRYRRAEGIEKLQLKYLVLGLTLFSLAAVSVNVILPTIGIFQLNSLGPIFSIFFVVAVSYSIVKHRLMDIRIILRKTIVQILISFFYLIIILGLIFLVAYYIGKRIPDLLLVFTGGVSMTILLFFYNPLKAYFERVANKYFFASIYNYQATLERLAKELTHSIDLDQIIASIVKTIRDTMKLDRTGVLLFDEKTNNYQVKQTIGFTVANGISLVRNNFLTNHLLKKRQPVIYQELESLQSNGNGEKSEISKLKANMKRIEASLCLPLIIKDKLIGIIVLGEKISKDAYTQEDLRLLESLANQAAIAMENARLYQQVQDFSQNLQNKVNEQTKDIREKNIRLEKLLKIRSEFLDIASHQLRTPVSVIRGIISMIRDGDMKRLPEAKQKQFIENAWEKGAKLDTIINDILSASELDSQKFIVNSGTPKIQLAEVVDQVVKSSKLEAEERDIDLQWRKPSNPLPKVQGHANFLEQAIANLVGNGLKYTPSTKMVQEARAQRKEKGVVQVGIKQFKDNIVVAIKDNGIGVPQQEIKKLFDKFARASNATAMYTDGSGLGLFIVKEIIDGHKGKVWVESKEGVGSTFNISLPVAK